MYQCTMSVRTCRQLPFILIKLILILMVMVLIHFFTIQHTWQHSILLGSKHLQSLPMFNLSDSLTDVQLLLSPKFCSKEIIDILSVVHSAVENFGAREAIRASWGASKQDYGVVSRVVFILGVGDNATLQEEVEDEYLMHGDIVQAEFIDAYRNMSYKNLLGLTWVSQICPQAKLIVKTDDDYFVDIYGIHHLSKELLSNPGFVNGSVLACPMLLSSVVFRDFENEISGQWAITQEELPSSKVQKWKKKGLPLDFYPPYCTGRNLLITMHSLLVSISHSHS